MILLNYITPTKTDFILFSDPDKATRGTIINTTLNSPGFLLVSGSLSNISWQREGEDLIINMDGLEPVLLKYNHAQPYYTVSTGNTKTYYYNFYDQHLIDLVGGLIYPVTTSISNHSKKF